VDLDGGAGLVFDLRPRLADHAFDVGSGWDGDLVADRDGEGDGGTDGVAGFGGLVLDRVDEGDGTTVPDGTVTMAEACCACEAATQDMESVAIREAATMRLSMAFPCVLLGSC
jgi:hypothetical protein